MTAPERRFWVLDETHPDCPESVPWSLLEPHEEWARINHDQSLQRLNARGGLSAREMVAILENRRLHLYRGMAEADAVKRLLELIAAWEASP